MTVTESFYRRVGLLVGLCCLLLAYVVVVVRSHPLTYFGLLRDDAIYFSSAEALASGHGYVLPFLPGSPRATKYPILYSYILSLVWRLNPHFPANLRTATAITVAFTLSFVVLSFVLFGQMQGFGTGEAFFLTAFIALHPALLLYGALVLSDIPFAVISLMAMILAEKSMQQKQDGAIAVIGSGALAGMSILFRIFGVPIIAGIFAAGLLRWSRRQLVIFCACVTPFFFVVAWPRISPAIPALPVSPAAAATFGWVHTWTFYTNYLAVWRIGVPDKHAFWAMLGNNLAVLVKHSREFLP
jgi:hypothetical protein